MEQSPHMHTPSDETGARTSMTQDFTEAVAGPFIGTIANLIQE
jgi:hypothetical protein